MFPRSISNFAYDDSPTLVARVLADRSGLDLVVAAAAQRVVAVLHEPGVAQLILANVAPEAGRVPRRVHGPNHAANDELVCQTNQEKSKPHFTSHGHNNHRLRYACLRSGGY